MNSIINIENFNLWYGAKQALSDVNLQIEKNKVTALIGPSGCGKSTLLRCINRMNDLVTGCKIEGSLEYNKENIYDESVDVNDVRKKIGMVFQKPNPFPMSIRDNICYGPTIHGIENRDELDEIVERTLKQASLWDEVKDRLDKSGLSLSGGQQQRLCIARALSTDPDVILMDEPTSALDPIATSKIEDLVCELSEKYTVVMVTHNMQQASRISNYTGFMYLGELIEFGDTEKIFNKPDEKMTERYITGRFG